MNSIRDDNIYEELADALGRLPNGFPRTASNVEISLLEKLFSPEQASIGARLTGELEPIQAIAERLGQSPDKLATQLQAMAERGLVWVDMEAVPPQFRLAPFIVGIYEFQLDNMDHELAHLFEHYMAEGGAAGIMQPRPAVHRVVPAQRAVKSEWVLPYDDVRKLLLGAKTFWVRDCICRKQQDHLGRKCDFPLRVCLVYSSAEGLPIPDTISQEEALAILDQVEEVGLVHTMSNVQTKSLLMHDVGYICNCCGCCCCVLRGITEWGIENSVAQANYYAVIDSERCAACGLCEQRCQVGAVSEQNGGFVVDRQRCIGCGLCVSGCPEEAATLHRKPDSEIVPPPLDLVAWQKERLQNRR